MNRTGRTKYLCRPFLNLIGIILPLKKDWKVALVDRDPISPNISWPYGTSFL
jgi:hypothetical protein